MVNKVTLIGNLGKDPEVRHLESGSVVARITVATNENYKDKSGEWQTMTEWHDVIAWRYLAERAERDLKKGSLVFVEGKLQKRKWQDKEGNDRYSVEVVAAVLKLLEKRQGSGAGPGAALPTSEDEFVPLNNGNTQSEAPSTNQSKPVADDDDLPF